MKKCIWCLGDVKKENVEHIIPEVLGCPDRFYLVGCVCESCNNGLGHLDQAVADDFDVAAFMAGVPRKKGRRPQICNRGNFVAKHTSEGPTFIVNTEDYHLHGVHNTFLGKLGASRRNIKPNIEVKGNLARIRFTTRIGENPKFVRGIYKIAFSSLAYFVGEREVLAPKYDAIRDFVTTGKGERRILLIASEDATYRHRVWPPYRSMETGEYAIILRLCMVEFAVDLTPQMSLFPSLLSQLRKSDIKNWLYLPIDKAFSSTGSRSRVDK